MTVTLDTEYDNNDSKIDFEPINTSRYRGRDVSREPVPNNTDEKTGWVTKKAMSGNFEFGGKIHIEAKWGEEGKGIQYSASIIGKLQDDKGNKGIIGFQKDNDGIGKMYFDADAAKKFGPDIQFDFDDNFDGKVGPERDS